jgi:putative SOS response-associated peptidase YedK
VDDKGKVIEYAATTAGLKKARSILDDRKLNTHAWPKAEMPVVIQNGADRELTTARWGVWPWYEKTKPRVFVDNARDDSLLTKRIWGEAVETGRCLIPADGFFEYAGQPGAKWEVMFRLTGNRPFFFAGLWQPDLNGEGRGFSMVTCQPNAMLAALPHDRMPVILPDSVALDWLGNMPLHPDRIRALCVPYDAADMTREDLPLQPRKGKAAPTKETDQPTLL